MSRLSLRGSLVSGAEIPESQMSGNFCPQTIPWSQPSAERRGAWSCPVLGQKFPSGDFLAPS